MPGPLHDTVPAPGTARRSDAGVVRLGQRDIDGLILCAEHYAAPYDLLAAALGAQPARLRAHHGAVAAGRVRRHRAAGTRPGLVLAHPGRDDRRRVPLPRRRCPSLARLAHIRAVLAARLWLQASPAWAKGRPWWHSERRLRAARPPGPAAGHVPDAEIWWPSTDASPYPGQVWAVEVELTAKSLGRTTAIMGGAAGRSGAVRAGAVPDRAARPARRDAGRGRDPRGPAGPDHHPGPARLRVHCPRRRRHDRVDAGCGSPSPCGCSARPSGSPAGCCSRCWPWRCGRSPS